MKTEISIDHESVAPRTISRRGLFQRLFSSAHTVIEKPEIHRIYRKAPRPPTCVDDSLLSRLCDGCGLCVEACPQQVISIINGKPELTLDCNHCTDCNACKTACPTLSLSNTLQFTGVRPQFSALCRQRSHRECDYCAEACPHHAIELKENMPYLLIEKCTGCGQCRDECPLSAISLPLVK